MGKRQKRPPPRGGLSCVILAICTIGLLLLLFVFLEMKYANG